MKITPDLAHRIIDLYQTKQPDHHLVCNPDESIVFIESSSDLIIELSPKGILVTDFRDLEKGKAMRYSLHRHHLREEVTLRDGSTKLLQGHFFTAALQVEMVKGEEKEEAPEVHEDADENP